MFNGFFVLHFSSSSIIFTVMASFSSLAVFWLLVIELFFSCQKSEFFVKEFWVVNLCAFFADFITDWEVFKWISPRFPVIFNFLLGKNHLSDFFLSFTFLFKKFGHTLYVQILYIFVDDRGTIFPWGPKNCNKVVPKCKIAIFMNKSIFFAKINVLTLCEKFVNSYCYGILNLEIHLLECYHSLCLRLCCTSNFYCGKLVGKCICCHLSQDELQISLPAPENFFQLLPEILLCIQCKFVPWQCVNTWRSFPGFLRPMTCLWNYHPYSCCPGQHWSHSTWWVAGDMVFCEPYRVPGLSLSIFIYLALTTNIRAIFYPH